MKIAYPFVAVDWGTTHMRAMLCSAPDAILNDAEILVGPGITRMERHPAEILLELIAGWTAKHGKLDLLLGGMIGSALGWRETPYQDCPTSPDMIAGNLLTFEERGHRVAIVPGVACTNTLGQPDVMRGEEIQVVGWMRRYRDDVQSQRLLCLPGTHTKWVSVDQGKLQRFVTSPTGELFSLLSKHSVLVKSSAPDEDKFDRKAFLEGIGLAARSEGQILHTLFSARSRSLRDPAGSGDTHSFLSGLLIGSDVVSTGLVETGQTGSVELIGVSSLCEKFQMALESLGLRSRCTDGAAAAFSGFLAIASGEALR
ncbi:MAG: 2-dehydro-3-deoxygalactonokinase [Pseudomonadota bacterium]